MLSLAQALFIGGERDLKFKWGHRKHGLGGPEPLAGPCRLRKKTGPAPLVASLGEGGSHR